MEGLRAADSSQGGDVYHFLSTYHVPGTRHSATFHWYNDLVEDFCSFLERRKVKFRKNYVEVNSKANLPALSIATHLPSGTLLERDSSTHRSHHLFIHFSSQHLLRVSRPLLCGCLILEGGPQEAHSAFLEKPGFIWERGHLDSGSTKAKAGVQLPAGMLPW